MVRNGPQSYATQTVVLAPDAPDALGERQARLPSIAPDALQRALGLRIGVLLVDCEALVAFEHDSAANAPSAPPDLRRGRCGVAARVRRLVRHAAGLRVSVRLARAGSVSDELGAPRDALGVVARPARRRLDCPRYAPSAASRGASAGA